MRVIKCPWCGFEREVPENIMRAAAPVFKCPLCGRAYLYRGVLKLKLRIARDRIEELLEDLKQRFRKVGRSKGQLKFGEFIILIEATLRGYDIQLFDSEGFPLTPRITVRRIESLLDSKKAKIFREKLGNRDLVYDLVLELQLVSRELEAKVARKEERKPPEIIIEGEDFYIVHPAGDVTPDGHFAFEYTLAPRRDDPSRLANVLLWYDSNDDERGYIVFSEGDSYVEVKGKKFFLTKRLRPERSFENPLSLQGLKNWISGHSPDPKDTWNRVLEFCKKYIYFIEPWYYHVLTAYIVATYFYYSFPSFPYIAPLGPIRSGKTTVLRVLRQLAYHSLFISRPREADVYRPVELYNPTLLNDEGDSIITYDPAIQDLYNIGFQRGARVPRQIKRGEEFVTEFFSAYCPKAIAFTNPPPPSIASRCIVLFMRGQPPGVDYGRFEDELIDLETGRPLRDDLYILRLLMAKRVVEVYKELNLYEEYGVAGRAASLFRPLIAVARAFCGQGSKEEDMLVMAAKRHEELVLEVRRGTLEAKILTAIVEVLKEYSPKDYESLRGVYKALLRGETHEAEATEVEVANIDVLKKLHELYPECGDRERRGYISREKLSYVMRQKLGYRSERKRRRTYIISLRRLAHDLAAYELHHVLDIEPETLEPYIEELGNVNRLRSWMAATGRFSLDDLLSKAEELEIRREDAQELLEKLKKDGRVVMLPDGMLEWLRK